MIPALAPVSPVLHGHRNVGASTGFMSDLYGDWPALLEAAGKVSTAAVELSALSEPELDPLVEFLGAGPPLPFLYLAVHAPSKQRRLPEAELVALLQRLPDRVDGVVVHADCIADPAVYAPLGSRLLIENMDRRKQTGRTAGELRELYEALPEAGLCFDVAHAGSVDATLAIGAEILDEHAHRLRHVHLSSLDPECHHRPLTEEDADQFHRLLDRCKDVPWILEAPLA